LKEVRIYTKVRQLLAWSWAKIAAACARRVTLSFSKMLLR